MILAGFDKSNSGGSGPTLMGTWNAATNTPTLTSSVGVANYYYVVSTNGTTTIDGISYWVVGDWIYFDGTVWRKILGSELWKLSGSTDITPATAGKNTDLGTGILKDNDCTAGIPLGEATTGTSLSSYHYAGSIIGAINESKNTFLSGLEEPTGFENRTDSTVSWDDATTTLTISGTFNVWYRGKRFTKTTASYKGDGTDFTISPGNWFFSYNSSGAIVISQGSWDIATSIQIAEVYWDGTKGIHFEERHGCKMDADTHANLHLTRRASIEPEKFPGTFTNTTFAIGAGTLYDEDLFNVITGQTSCRVMYRNSTTNYIFTTPQTAYFHKVSNILQYDNGGSLANVTDGRYMCMWCYATNAVSTPIMFKMGQREDINIANCRANNTPDSLNWLTIPTAEMKLLFRVIIKRNGTSVEYQETTDYRNTSTVPSNSYIATSHSTLSNLLADDHSQYLLLAGRSGQTISDNVTITGDLTINGTTTTINTTNLAVTDNNITLGNVTTPTDATADGGGFTLLGTTNKTLTWDNTNDNFTFNQSVNIESGLTYKINNVSINTGGTLNNVAYLNQANTFSQSQKLNDGLSLIFGNDSDCSIYESGGHLYVKTDVSEKNIYFNVNNYGNHIDMLVLNANSRQAIFQVETTIVMANEGGSILVNMGRPETKKFGLGYSEGSGHDIFNYNHGTYPGDFHINLSVKSSAASMFRIRTNDNGGTPTYADIFKLDKTGFMSLLETTAPSNESGWGKVYVKSSDHLPYFKAAGGTEYSMANAPAGNTTEIQFNNAGAMGSSAELTYATRVLGLTSSSPTITMYNSTGADTEGARASLITFKGKQSGDEVTTLGKIECSHYGTGNDEKGKFVFYLNDTDDGASPTSAMKITATDKKTFISQVSSDGSDDKTLVLCGGGEYTKSRGGTIFIRGNEIDNGVDGKDKGSVVIRGGGNSDAYCGGVSLFGGDLANEDGSGITGDIFVEYGGGIRMNRLSGSTGYSDMRYNPSGGVVFYDTSSIRYKENITKDGVDCSAIYDLNIVKFDRIDKSKLGELGMIAEDVNEKIPDVCYSKNGLIEGYNKSDLVPYLIKCIQEINERLIKLETKQRRYKTNGN